jgi:hypothetical protein
MWEKVVVPLARLPSQLRMTSVSLGRSDGSKIMFS